MSVKKVGIIGCGKISDIYLNNCANVFNNLQIVACADLIYERAKGKTEKYDIPKACTVEEILSDPGIDIILNLTVPSVHAELCLKALNSGKNVYVEKPLSVTREDGKKIMGTAREKGLKVGCAPDTFLGAGLQTCRKLIDDGLIGEPIGATAFMMGAGPEDWHPDPEFFYKPGGGPMFDVGPYYLTALVFLLGPAVRVTGSARVSYKQRTITSQLKYGTKIDVEVPTHIAGVIDFESGPVASVITSFDVMGGSMLPRIEIYGSEGTLEVPDPNTFKGPVMFRKKGKKGETEFVEIPLIDGLTINSRGIGLSDMAYSLDTGAEHRANGELAYHVLDIMHGIHDSSSAGTHHMLSSRCKKPDLLPPGYPEVKPGV